jgi:hypothetical protein
MIHIFQLKKYLIVVTLLNRKLSKCDHDDDGVKRQLLDVDEAQKRKRKLL